MKSFRINYILTLISPAIYRSQQFINLSGSCFELLVGRQFFKQEKPNISVPQEISCVACGGKNVRMRVYSSTKFFDGTCLCLDCGAEF